MGWFLEKYSAQDTSKEDTPQEMPDVAKESPQAPNDVMGAVGNYFKWSQPAFKWAVLGMPEDVEGIQKAETGTWGDVIGTAYPSIENSPSTAVQFVKETAGDLLDLGTKPSSYIMSYALPKVTEAVALKIASTPAGKAWLEKYLPTISKGTIDKAGLNKWLEERTPLSSRGVEAVADDVTGLEVPADVKKYAGSLNLDKFPEETHIFLKEASQKFPNEVAEARRGVMTFADQKAMAEQLKGSVNMETLKAGDILNVENRRAVALRIIDDAKGAMQSGDIKAKEQVVNNLIKLNGLHTEAGRLLGSMRDPLFDTEGDILKQLAKELPHGKEAIDSFLKNQIANPTFWDKATEFHTAKLLTSPITYERNAIGNTIGRALKIPERAFAGGFDAVRSAITGTPRERYATEAIADTIGMFSGMKQGVKQGLDVLLGKAQLEGARSAESGVRAGAIKGLKGEIIRTPFKILNAFDAFASTTSKTSSLYAQAYRQAIKDGGKDIIGRTAELVKNPTLAMIKNASSEALDETYRTELGEIGGLANMLVSKSKVGKILQPFFKTPVNIAKFAFQRSPLGVVSPKNISDIMKGGGKQADAFARIALGSGISAYLTSLALDGHITAQLSSNKAEREALMRQGIQPYSVKIGDKYFSYRGLEPISSMLALSAGIAEQIDDKESPLPEKVVNLIGIVSKNLIDQPFLQGVRSLADAMEDPKRFGQSYLQSMSRTFGSAPALGYLRTIEDPYQREVNSVMDAWLNSLPYASRTLKPKLDVWGDEIKRDDSALQRALSPVRVTQEKKSALESGLMETPVGFPTKKLGGVKMTNDEYREFVKATGGVEKAILTKMTSSPKWQELPVEERMKIVDSVVSKVRTSARKAIRQRKEAEGAFKSFKNPKPKFGSSAFYQKYGGTK